MNIIFDVHNFILLMFTNSQFNKLPKVNGFLIRRGKGKLIVGKNLKINSSLTSNPVGLTTRTLFYIDFNGSIIVGNNVGISNSLFYAKSEIIIEDDVLIGGGCQIFDTDFHSLSYSERVLNSDVNLTITSEKVKIKRGAFIGASSIILKGVTIGQNAIVGAGSVVAKSIPDLEVWAGNPARYIKNVEN